MSMCRQQQSKVLRALLGAILITLAITSDASPQSGQPTEVDAPTLPSCRLVVNRDMNTGNPCLEVITDSDRSFPVVRDISVHNDTTVHITLYLPYTLPTQDYRPFDLGSSPTSFHIYAAYDNDTAHYLARTTVDSGAIVLQPIREKAFIKPCRVNSFPEDVVVVQLVGNDDRLRREIKTRLTGLTEETTLKPGFYDGIPRQVREVELGAGRFNETCEGRLLVMKSKRPLDFEALAQIETVINERNLAWYSAPAVDR